MFTVDREHIDINTIQSRFKEMQQFEAYCHPEGRRYALCLSNAFDLLTIVMYIKERGGSVLLMHDSTPYERAIQIAQSAQCTYLTYNKWDTISNVGPSMTLFPPALLQYSSGTSRAPTLIARSWDQVETEIKHYNMLFEESTGVQPIILVPISHSFGLITGVLAAIARGDKPIIIQDKNPKFTLQVVNSVAQHIVYTVPFLYHILESLGKGQTRFHKMVISGAPPSDQLLHRMNLHTEEIWQQYGCTEVGCISLNRSFTTFSDVGTPLSHLQISIRANADRLDEAHGEIIVTNGKQVIETGDLGYIDTHTEHLHVLSRLDDLINVSGLKVIPSEVESVIAQTPGIKEVVVLRTAHKVWGEAIKAIVVAEPSIEEKEIRAKCIQQLPAYKVPHVIQIVEEIPRTSAGKLSRKYLQELER